MIDLHELILNWPIHNSYNIELIIALYFLLGSLKIDFLQLATHVIDLIAINMNLHDYSD